MAYRLQPGESVREGLRRIAREELASAAGGLRQATARTRDDAIHEARKSVKKVRAILRLMRGELGGMYAVENRRLRDVSRRLAVYRDGMVMIETLDQLGRRQKDDRAKPALAATRRGLVENRRRQRRGPRMTIAMRRAADALLVASAHVSRWRLVMDGPVALAPGMEWAYRRGRAAMAAARRHAQPEHCHEWRKRVKDHWYHLRLLEARWDAVTRARERSLKELETWLGEHHNLEVLSARLAAEAAAGRKPKEADICRGLIGEWQRELRHKALALGERLYGEPTELFRKQLAQLWRPRAKNRRQGPPALRGNARP
ncbi:MAG: CHAD domain-containing protein [Bryobacteraceae bacterium]